MASFLVGSGWYQQWHSPANQEVKSYVEFMNAHPLAAIDYAATPCEIKNALPQIEGKARGPMWITVGSL